MASMNDFIRAAAGRQATVGGNRTTAALPADPNAPTPTPPGNAGSGTGEVPRDTRSNSQRISDAIRAAHRGEIYRGW